ncbi:UvrD-helicase domain-containing protein [Megamonas hypermegale]|uniref:UvrD-helicase domain-containing protein n=1 Tax=Megamonas hypermegale TaxID=158847 RepID=UPI00195D388B|nr:UvrD-helicase domain-containing protein [Megamonas hypermegale]MBM6832290.1 ATP-dependent helicase [Megamonas hypermegale]
MTLTKSQQEILNYTGNIVVKASAGTGKTHILVEKIKQKLSEEETYKKIAAITFTIKASNEIKERLKIFNSEHFIGTNNSFAINEVIIPFIRDVFGGNYNKNISTDYLKTFKTFDEGLSQIQDENIIGSYKNELKKNFVFELANKILNKSKACQLYLKARYSNIYIDEYQDCDNDMNDFFLYLCNNLKITTFIVGDSKQSLYTWRGAYPKLFNDICRQPNFKVFSLIDNFRSCEEIKNYSYLFFKETQPFFKQPKENKNIIYLSCDNNNWINKLPNLLNLKSKSMSILRFKNFDAENCFHQLKNMNFVYLPHLPINDITNDSAIFFSEISKFICLNNYPKYSIINSYPEEAITNQKKLLQQLTDLKNNYHCYLHSDKLFNKIEQLANLINLSINQEDFDKFKKTITNTKYIPSLEPEKYSKVCMTIHSSKGLAFDEVVIFLSDFFQNDFRAYEHYVAITRAKNKLIIIDTSKYLLQLQKMYPNINFLEKIYCCP